jgi:hypothetical protein
VTCPCMKLITICCLICIQELIQSYGSGRIDDATAGQFSDSRNHVTELCMDSVQAYVGKQHSMLPVGIRSCDIPFSHRDGKVRASKMLIILLISHHGLRHLHLINNLT